MDNAMAQDTTIHVKVEPSVAEGLRRLAQHRKQTVGELVRQAISTCYQPDLLGLSDVQRQAVEAYRGGYISLGRLAERLGLSPVATRRWLKEHDIDQNTCFSLDDSSNA